MYKILIGIPAFNEASVIKNVLQKLPKKLKDIEQIEVIVVDDGSTDDTSKVVLERGFKVIRHLINLGLGASIGTLFTYARQYDFDILITLDGDGQHDPKDINKLIRPVIDKQADVVIGSRLIKEVVLMPFTRRIVNLVANLITYFLSGIYSTDSQSGFRVFSRKAINSIEIITQRMEVSSEIFREVKRHRLRYREIPIKTKYTNYSIGKGQKINNAVNIFYKLLIRSMRR